MIFKTHILKLATQKPIEILDITSEVESFVKKSDLKNGLLVAASQHTTACVRINEKCEHLEKDLEVFFKKLADPKHDYFHNHSAVDGRDNAHSHLLSYLVGSSETIVVQNGKLELGTWQRLFFVELDGARPNREVHLTFIGA